MAETLVWMVMTPCYVNFGCSGHFPALLCGTFRMEMNNPGPTWIYFL